LNSGFPAAAIAGIDRREDDEGSTGSEDFGASASRFGDMPSARSIEIEAAQALQNRVVRTLLQRTEARDRAY
jgi:hypothetical protein